MEAKRPVTRSRAAVLLSNEDEALFGNPRPSRQRTPSNAQLRRLMGVGQESIPEPTTSRERSRSPIFYRSKMEDVKSKMECAICRSARKTYFICVCGKSICGECQVECKACPHCRGPKPMIRNLMVEEVAAIVLQRCPFAFRGCSFLAEKEDLKTHSEDSCYYRLASCSSHPECGQKPIIELAEHSRKVHGASLVQGRGRNVRYPIPKATGFQDRYFLKTQVMHWDERVFIFVSYFHNGYLHFHSSLIGPKIEAKKYVALIDVNELMCPGREFRFPVTPIDYLEAEIWKKTKITTKNSMDEDSVVECYTERDDQFWNLDIKFRVDHQSNLSRGVRQRAPAPAPPPVAPPTN